MKPNKSTYLYNLLLFTIFGPIFCNLIYSLTSTYSFATFIMGVFGGIAYQLTITPLAILAIIYSKLHRSATNILNKKYKCIAVYFIITTVFSIINFKFPLTYLTREYSDFHSISAGAIGATLLMYLTDRHHVRLINEKPSEYKFRIVMLALMTWFTCFIVVATNRLIHWTVGLLANIMQGSISIDSIFSYRDFEWDQELGRTCFVVYAVTFISYLIINGFILRKHRSFKSKFISALIFITLFPTYTDTRSVTHGGYDLFSTTGYVLIHDTFIMPQVLIYNAYSLLTLLASLLIIYLINQRLKIDTNHHLKIKACPYRTCLEQ